MNKVRVLETRFDGYERLYLLELINSHKRIWAYGLDHSNYIENGVDRTEFNIEGEPTFSIEWVRELKEDPFEDDGLTQSIDYSSHTECKVTVIKLIDSDSFECKLPEFGLLRVELEFDTDSIVVGRKFSFTGNLRVDFNK